MELSIEVEDDTVAVGGQVRGDVVLTAPAQTAVATSGGTVELFWRTVGAGARTHGASQTLLLPPASLAPAETQRLAFSFDVPGDASVSVRGQLVGLTWVVRATVDLPRASDPSVEREVTIVPRARDQVPGSGYRGGPRLVPASELSADASRLAPETVIAFLTGALVLAFVGIVVVAVHDLQSTPAIAVFGAPTLALYGWLVQTPVRSALARRRIGTPVVLFTPRVARGDDLEVEVALAPRREVHVREIAARLRGIERATRGSGRSSRTQERVVLDAKVVLAGSTILEPAREGRWSGRIPVPQDAAPTMHEEGNVIAWELEVSIDVADWPDDHETFTVEVVA